MRQKVADLTIAARRAARLSQRELARRSGVAASTVARIELARIDTTIETLAKLVRASGSELIVTTRPRRGTRSKENGMTIEPPTTYPPLPNRPLPNLWDHDAVSWLVKKPDVATRFSYLPLFEHLRRQDRLMARNPGRVEEAAAFARKYGVIQRSEYDPAVGKTVVRFYRTDPDRPRYPGDPPAGAA